MQTVCWLILLTGCIPLWLAWRANRRTSLLQAVQWAGVSWATWVVALAVADAAPGPAAVASCYLALAMTGCAAIAVLGARRPLFRAWNFVVAALLVIDFLPLAEALLRGGNLQLETFRILCVVATITVGVLNYLLTRLAPAALLLSLGCAFILALVLIPEASEQRPQYLLLGSLMLASVPWIAYRAIRARKRAAAEFDRLWLDFRDRFGFVWAQRLRDQFNRSAAHAGWPIILRWQGLRLVPGQPRPDAEMESAAVSTLRALLKRFGPEERPPRPKDKQPTEDG
jgi:hypothetical protein